MKPTGSRFDYVAYDKDAQTLQLAIKDKTRELEHLIEKKLPNGRWKSFFMTQLEIAYMATGKAIRDMQLARNADTVLEEGRSNE